MPYLTFDDDPDTRHVMRNLDTAPPRVIIALQQEIGWGLEKIRDEIKGADFYGGVLTAWLTVAVAGRPVTWDYLLDTPMKEWPWTVTTTPGDEAMAADQGTDAQDPPQPSPQGSAEASEPEEDGGE